MSSTLYVDSLIEKTSGNGVHIPGHVIQVVNLVNTTANAANTTADYPVASGFKLSITPSSTSSKILVLFDIHAWLDSGGLDNKIGKYGIRLNSQSNIIVSHKRISFNASGSSSQDLGAQAMLTYLDSPNSTSAQEYELVMGRWSVGYDNNVTINGGGFGHSHITLMEIAQ